jgi:hypothetical protein
MLRLLAWLDLEDPNQRHLMNLVLENAQTLQQDFSEQLWPERPVTSIGFRDCPMRK